MALFFQNNYMKCPKCGGDIMSLQQLYHFEEKEASRELVYEPCSKVIVCAKCGTPVKTVDNFTTIKSKE